MIEIKDKSIEIGSLRKVIDDELLNITKRDRVPIFYDPIYYTNNLKGKRLRPLLSLVCGLAAGGSLNSLLFPSTAIELLHNFTLVHDDIMDNDDMRRGKKTVHVKWDIGTAILAGDGLLGLAYKKLLATPDVNIGEMAKLFTNTLIDICEGQALDKTFETINTVSESDYLEMIEKKTAVLIRLSCHLGAMTANTDKNIIHAFSDFGYNIGMGFQIQDDLLDIFADEAKLGKKVGSDLVMNKKTILTTKLADTGETPYFFNDIESFKDILTKRGIVDQVSNMVDDYFEKAFSLFDSIPNNDYKDTLIYLVNYIKNRDK